MTPRELEMARSAAARFLPQPEPEEAKEVRKLSRKSPVLPGYTHSETRALFIAANESYEARKLSGVNVAMVELEFGLNVNSLKSWRHRRMAKGDQSIRRIYINRPTKTKA